MDRVSTGQLGPGPMGNASGPRQRALATSAFAFATATFEFEAELLRPLLRARPTRSPTFPCSCTFHLIGHIAYGYDMGAGSRSGSGPDLVRRLSKDTPDSVGAHAGTHALERDKCDERSSAVCTGAEEALAHALRRDDLAKKSLNTNPEELNLYDRLRLKRSQTLDVCHGPWAFVVAQSHS